MLQKDENEAILKLNPIGIIRSPYKEKFAVPRQPNLVPDVEENFICFLPMERQTVFGEKKNSAISG